MAGVYFGIQYRQTEGWFIPLGGDTYIPFRLAGSTKYLAICLMNFCGYT
jgi:hypothetical protein